MSASSHTSCAQAPHVWYLTRPLSTIYGRTYPQLDIFKYPQHDHKTEHEQIKIKKAGKAPAQTLSSFPPSPFLANDQLLLQTLRNQKLFGFLVG